MMPLTLVPAMSASIVGPLGNPVAFPPRFAGASCVGDPFAPVCRGASAATSAVAACSNTRVSVTPQEGHANPSEGSVKLTVVTIVTGFWCWPVLFCFCFCFVFFPRVPFVSGTTVAASTLGDTQSPQNVRAQQLATTVSDGESPQMEHTHFPCSAAARIMPRSAEGSLRADAIAETETFAATGETSAAVCLPVVKSINSTDDATGATVNMGLTPPTSDGWLHACRRRSSMCNRLT
mmetsp:Transcript_1323/g.4430  ORF Transcript_1323/g.4430 Transcript_1323/m.4430 type:complete len:235 (+) Transcript_1323:905-1609(+)